MSDHINAYYDSDEEVAWGPITLREIKKDLKTKKSVQSNYRRQTIDGNISSSSSYVTAYEDDNLLNKNVPTEIINISSGESEYESVNTSKNNVKESKDSFTEKLSQEISQMFRNSPKRYEKENSLDIPKVNVIPATPRATPSRQKLNFNDSSTKFEDSLIISSDDECRPEENEISRDEESEESALYDDKHQTGTSFFSCKSTNRDFSQMFEKNQSEEKESSLYKPLSKTSSRQDDSVISSVDGEEDCLDGEEDCLEGEEDCLDDEENEQHSLHNDPQSRVSSSHSQNFNLSNMSANLEESLVSFIENEHNFTEEVSSSSDKENEYGLCETKAETLNTLSPRSSTNINEDNSYLNDTLDDMEELLRNCDNLIRVQNNQSTSSEGSSIQQNFKIPKTPLSTKGKILKPLRSPSVKNNYKDIVSPVRLYIKNSALPVLKQSHRPILKNTSINVNENTIPSPPKHQNLVDSFPEVIYKPSKLVIENNDEKIILPSNIKKLITERTVIKHEIRKKINLNDTIHLSDDLNRSDISTITSDDKNMSVHVNKQGFNL